ncbi:MAG TPA: MBL fold metallo-hydrolase [Gemmatimonadota bacterium]|nr:MBL fold metallo-hydrolase [Gemmatimonadota bacterium]
MSTPAKCLGLVLLVSALIPEGSGPPTARPTRPPDAAALWEIDSAVDAMGGMARLRALRSLRLEGMREKALLGVSADRRHPKAMFVEVSELRDLSSGRALVHQRATLPMRPDPIPFTRATGGPGAPPTQRTALALTPERILFTARDADPKVGRDTVFDGRPARVVRFGPEPVRLFLDADTHPPLGWMATLTYPDDPNEWGIWGDVRSATHWSDWSLEPDGLRYPRTVTEERNGLVSTRTTWSRVTPDAPVAEDSFPAPARSSAPAGAAGASEDVRTLAPGVALLCGSYNVLLVAGDDGVVVLDAPVSSERSRAVLDETRRRFPDRPVRALVLTSAVWPHVAGVRAYVARGIPVYAPAPAAQVVRDLAAAPHCSHPDSLARAPRRADVRVVTDSVVIGGGADRLVLLAPRLTAAPHAAAGLVAYLPERRILYAGDLLVPRRFEPNFWRQSWDELRRLVAARGLPVLTVASLHDDPIPWSDVGEALDAGSPAP